VDNFGTVNLNLKVSVNIPLLHNDASTDLGGDIFPWCKQFNSSWNIPVSFGKDSNS